MEGRARTQSVSGCGLDGSVPVPGRAEILLSIASSPVGTGGSFLGVNQPQHTADLSPPPSAKVKNMWTYTSTPHTSWHGT
jgi:hypothetical protein